MRRDKPTRAEIVCDTQRAAESIIEAIDNYKQAIIASARRLQGAELRRYNQDRAARVAAYRSIVNLRPLGWLDNENELPNDCEIFSDENELLREILAFIPYDSTHCRKLENRAIAIQEREREYAELKIKYPRTYRRFRDIKPLAGTMRDYMSKLRVAA